MKEHIMRRLVTAAAAALFTLAAVAQQPQQCVNPQQVNGLVFLGRSDMKISVTRNTPAFMSGLNVPAELVLIGTGVRTSGMTNVAYKSALTTDKAHAAAVAAHESAGWAVEAMPGSAANFNIAGNPKEVTLCRDAERHYVTVNEVAGTRYVNVTTSREIPRRQCSENPGMSAAIAGVRSSTVRFQFPAGTSLAQGAGMGSGSNSMFTTTSRVISEETPVALVAHLASQLEAQGWNPDTGWSGSGSAGSTWRRSLDGELTSGMLEIVRVSAGTYDVNFTLALSQ
jgi:hypothetical protein